MHALLTTVLRCDLVERLAVIRPSHLENVALRFDRLNRAMLLNESDPQVLFLAKKTATLFKVSRTIPS